MSDQHKKQLKRNEHQIKKQKQSISKSKDISKRILDQYATEILRKDALHEVPGDDGKKITIPNSKKAEMYDSDTYDTDIILWKPPPDSIAVEFEDSPEKNQTYIHQLVASAKALDLDYCVTEHKGGKSPYFRLFNIKGIPLNEDNKKAKELLIDTIIPTGAKKQLDTTNLSYTWSPVIGHSHWKKKYHGAMHKLIIGKNPLDHKNEYPKELLRQIKKSKQKSKAIYLKTKQNDDWVEDFLLDYCCNNKLPGGQRHHIIEKNLAILIYHRRDSDEIRKQYCETQGRKNDTLTTWFNAIGRGEYPEVSAGELRKYINDNDLPYITVGQKHDETKKPKRLNDQQKQQIKEHLTKPSLLVDTIKEVQKNGVAGEEDTILALCILSSTRLVKNVSAEAKNLFLSDKTGLGKDYTTNKTLEVILPENLHFHVTKMTPEAFTYWHNSENEPDWTWDDKVIHFEDITQSLLNCSTFKTMASGGSHAVVVIDQETKLIKINGKPVMIATSHHANPEDEALRRFPIGGLDETDEQTKRIKKNIAEHYAGKGNEETNQGLRLALQELRSFPVIIPYAELLQYCFPDDTLMRTHFKRFLDYISASCVFHQGQRKLKDGVLIAEPDDYMIARMVLIYTSSFEQMKPISKEFRDVIEIIRDNEKEMTVKELFLHPSFNHSKMWLYRHLPKITELGIIKKTSKEIDDANKKVDAYVYTDINARALPTWNKIIDAIKKVDVKTVKTVKTKNKSTEENDLIKWFSQPMLKPVFTALLKPTNREVLTVFTVLTNFLKESNEKKFGKYYEDPDERKVADKKSDHGVNLDEWKIDDNVPNLVSWLNEKHDGEYTGDPDDDPDFPFSIQTINDGKTNGIIELLDKPLRLCVIPEEKKNDDSSAEEKEMYLQKAKEFLSEHPKTKYDLDKIGMAVGLGGMKGKKLLKEIMENEIIQNGEYSFFMKHDDSGYYWSCRSGGNQ